MSFRVTPDRKNQLDEAARKSGRSTAAEVELRLEQSFDREAFLEPALALKYGPRVARMLLIMGNVMTAAGKLAMFEKTRGSAEAFELEADSWLTDPFSFDQVAWSLATLVEGLRPPGDVAFVRPSVPHATALVPEVLGQHLAAGMLNSLKHPFVAPIADTAAVLEARRFAIESVEKLPGVSISVPRMARRAEGRARARQRREDQEQG
jgi:hypothetical protein